MTDTAVVIGAGVAGMTAAALLSRLGREVVIVERAVHTAPLLRGFERGDTYCDLGLHYTGGLAPGGLLDRLFTSLGVDCEPEPMERGGFDCIRWPEWGLDLEVPVGLEAFEDSLNTAFPQSVSAVRRWIGITREVLAKTPFLNPGMPPWQATRVHSERVSLAEFLREAGGEPRLIEVLGRYGENLFGMGAEETPITTHAAVIGSYLQSAHTVRGGGKVLADAFTDRLGSFGARIITDGAVERITVDAAGKVGGVVLAGGESISADTVIFTPHPALLPGMLAEGRLRELFERRMMKTENTKSMFLTYLRSGYPAAAGSSNTYLFFEDRGKGSSRVRQVAVMAGSPQNERWKSSLCLISDLPPDAFRGVNRKSDVYRAKKRELSDLSVQAAREWTNAVDVDAEIIESLSPLSFEHWTGTKDGSAYGVKRKVSGRRLHSQTAVPNLFLAGQSALYPGIMGAVASGLVASCHAAGSQPTWELLRE